MRTRAGKLKFKLPILGFLSATALVVTTFLAIKSKQIDAHTSGFLRAGESTLEDSDRRLGSAELECNEDKLMVLPYMLLILYCFLGLAIICDDYFEPVLSRLSEVFGLSEDVAGATFMAAGSSAPELLTSVNDVFFTKNSIGVGTIVGSAMFNVLVIVGLSALAVPGVIRVDWRPVVRDSVFYVSSIILMGGFMLNQGGEWCEDSFGNLTLALENKTWQDELEAAGLTECGKGVIEYWEGWIMVGVYFLYILFMVFNARILDMCARSEEDIIKDHEVFNLPEDKRHSLRNALDLDDVGPQIMDNKNEEDPAFEHPLAFPVTLKGRFWYVLIFPLNGAFYLTVPNVETARFRNWYWMSFLVIIAWISAFCYVMVRFASRVGCLLSIDPVIMGVVLLAAGTSVPDAIASIIVARQGFAGMAVANALGSNVFDILLGLGLPWALAPLVFDRPTVIETDGIISGVILLLGTVTFFLLVLLFSKFRLGKKIGVLFICFYVAYITWTMLTEKCVINWFDLNDDC